MKRIFINVLLYLFATRTRTVIKPIAILWTRFMLTPAENAEYLRQLAIAEDRYGNVLLQHIFNKHLIKPQGYKFGNGKEPISSAVGKNVMRDTLLKEGKQLDTILNRFEANHSVKSIDYNV